MFGVFRVKNHDFTPKNHSFSNFRGGGASGAAPPGSVPAVCLHRQSNSIIMSVIAKKQNAFKFKNAPH